MKLFGFVHRVVVNGDNGLVITTTMHVIDIQWIHQWRCMCVVVVVGILLSRLEFGFVCSVHLFWVDVCVCGGVRCCSDVFQTCGNGFKPDYDVIMDYRRPIIVAHDLVNSQQARQQNSHLQSIHKIITSTCRLCCTTKN